MTAPPLTRQITIETISPHRHRSIHHVAIAVVLYGLMTVAGTSSVWSADEGAFLYQASALADGDGWSFSHPFPEADPDGTAFPLHLSSWSQDAQRDGQECPAQGVSCRYVVFAKHVGYVWLGVLLFKLGGYGAVIALSVAGAIGAAIATSRLAGHVEPRAELPALWIAGLGSPLFINAFIGWAHTPAAGLIGLAAYALHVRVGSTRWVIVGGVALGFACLLRTEATLAGLAMGVGWLGVARFWSRDDSATDGKRRREQSVAGIVALGATVFFSAIDRLTATPTAGPVEPPSFDEAFGLIGGRLEGFMNTWLKPGYVTRPLDLVPLVAATALIGGAIMARRRQSDTTVATAAALIAAAAMAARFLISPVALIPGLVVAFPMLFVGFVLLRRTDLRDREFAGILVPFVLFCCAVLATQYRGGGGGEWGGRYFAIGLPLGIAASTVGVARAFDQLGKDDRRRLGLLVIAPMVLLQLLGLLGIRSIRDRTVELQDNIAAATADAGDGDQRPVIVTTMNGLGRWLWEDLDDVRMLRVPDEDLAALGERLDAIGVSRFTLVSNEPVEAAGRLRPWFAPAEPPDGKSAVVTLHATVEP